MGFKEKCPIMEPGRFLRNCVIAIVSLTAAMALLNFVMDPYLIFGMPRDVGFNARKPAMEKQAYLIKTYDVMRAHPRTVLLGGSSIGVGLDPESPVWPDQLRPVYNLALPSGTPLVAYRYLQHLTAEDSPKLIVLGVDFRDVVPIDKTPEYDSHLRVNLDGSLNSMLARQQLYDLLQASLSLDTSIDSITSLSGNLAGNSSDIQQGGLEYRVFRNLPSEVGSLPLIALNDFNSSFRYSGAKVNMAPLKHIRAILDLCRERQIEAVLVIDPSHADEQEIFDLEGKWPVLEDWKRRVTQLVAEYAHRGMHIELWDFYGYSSYSTEPVPADGHALQWFIDPEHYTRALGEVVLRRIFEGTDGSFGVRLTPENIEAHLQEVRSAQASYRAAQRSDAERVRNIHALAVATHSGSDSRKMTARSPVESRADSKPEQLSTRLSGR